MGVLSGKTIVLGVSGGIAAYKSAELVRLLVNAGANVRVMMTRNATEFITPLTLQTLSAESGRDRHLLAHAGIRNRAHPTRRQRRRDRDRARDGRRDRQGRRRYRRRHRDDRAARDARESRVRARDERAHVRSSDGRRESRQAAVARRRDNRAGRGRARVRLRRQGPAAGPGDRRRGNREDALRAGSGGRKHPGDGGADARADRSGAIRLESVRRARWDLRLRARHGVAARRCESSRDRRRSRRLMASSESTR